MLEMDEWNASWVEYDTALEGLECVFWTLTIRAYKNQSPYFTAEEIEV